MLKKLACSILILSLITLTGCKDDKKTTVSYNSGSSSVTAKAGPTGEVHISDTLDLKKCSDDTIKFFTEGDYPKMDISISPPANENDFFNIIIVAVDRPEDENVYAEWMKTCLEKLNSEAIKQDPEFKPSSDGYYGELFDQYSVMLTATCNDDMVTRWPVNQKIEAGKHDVIQVTEGTLDLSGLE